MADDEALANLQSTITSTGNAANITSESFFAYANELQKVTGTGADQITQGAALLATFKNVRNEVGAGNQVFNRATKAALDLSKKGFGDLSGSNKMLGKALNDPIRASLPFRSRWRHLHRRAEGDHQDPAGVRPDA
jgi:hypothetical protein